MKLTRQPWIVISALALIVAVGGWLRFQVATNDLLWLDELHTGWVVDAPAFSDIASRAADGNQTPVYFWITRLLIQLPIQPELGLRLASLFAGIALNLIASLWVWRWSGSRLGALLTATLIASDLNFIYYSTEARPYALMELLSIFQFGLFFELLWPSAPKLPADENAHPKSNLKLQIPFALVSLVMLYTHLTSVWLLVTEGLTLAICFLKYPTLVRRIQLWLPATAIICGGFLPFAFVTRNIYSRRTNWESVSSIPNLLTNYLPVLLITIIAPLLFWGIYLIFKKQKSRLTVRQRQQLGLILLWAIIPFCCVIPATLIGIAPLALNRYTLIGAAAIPIFAGCFAVAFQSVVERTIFVTLLLCSMIFAGNSLSPDAMNPFAGKENLPHFRVEDWRTPIEKINSVKGGREQPVFLFANIIEDADATKIDDLRFQNYLLFPLSWPYLLNRTYPNVSAGATLAEPHFRPTQIQQALESRGCWVIVRGNKELAERIGLELEVNLKVEMAENSTSPPIPMQTQFYETPRSPVYLISVSW